ncbi:hypothetical protein [Streptomyces mirabilis]|uniref:hypothetical protein n=1 Tax=Streptomyces mirabilis TaxID=68239 RepID=UPI003803B50B
MLPAAADDAPTFNQISWMTPHTLLADCDSGVGKCTFNDPQVSLAYLGDFHTVSGMLYNCSSSPATQGISWADTVGAQDAAGGTISTSVLSIIGIRVEAAYSHVWLTEHTETSTTNVTVQPGEVGWVERAQVMQDVTGTLQTHYDEPRYGHYYWFLTETASAPAPNGTDDTYNGVVAHSRAMTDEERAALCSSRTDVFLHS